MQPSGNSVGNVYSTESNLLGIVWVMCTVAIVTYVDLSTCSGSLQCQR